MYIVFSTLCIYFEQNCEYMLINIMYIIKGSLGITSKPKINSKMYNV